MKKIFLSLLFLTGITVQAYVPVTGPLCLGDSTDALGFVTHRGQIMKVLQTNTALHSYLQAICRFAGVPSCDKLPAYQDIMETLYRMPESTYESEAAIEAFEYAIMYAYDQQIYIVGGYSQYLSTLVSGLRWRALNPFSYLNPFSWVTENHEKGTQLIYEFEQLTEIAHKIGSRHYARLQITLWSYKHWRMLRLLSGVVVLYTAGLACHDYWTSKGGQAVHVITSNNVQDCACAAQTTRQPDIVINFTRNR